MARRRRRYSWALQFSPGSTEVQRLSREAREGLTFATLLAESARENSRAALSGDPHEPVTVARIAAEEEHSPVAVHRVHQAGAGRAVRPRSQRQRDLLPVTSTPNDAVRALLRRAAVHEPAAVACDRPSPILQGARVPIRTNETTPQGVKPLSWGAAPSLLSSPATARHTAWTVVATGVEAASRVVDTGSGGASAVRARCEQSTVERCRAV